MRKLLQFVRSSMLWVLLLPYGLFYFGAGLNQLVFWANDGKFPVRYNAYVTEAFKINQFAKYQEYIAKSADTTLKHEDRVEAAVHAEKIRAMAETGMLDEEHTFMTSQTHLNLLADIVNLHDGIYSAGDGILYAGEFLETPAFIFWLALVLYKESKRASEKA